MRLVAVCFSLGPAIAFVRKPDRSGGIRRRPAACNRRSIREIHHAPSAETNDGRLGIELTGWSPS